jgi:hypothetical protein
VGTVVVVTTVVVVVGTPVVVVVGTPVVVVVGTPLVVVVGTPLVVVVVEPGPAEAAPAMARIPEASSQRVACIFIATSPRAAERTGPEMDPAPA